MGTAKKIWSVEYIDEDKRRLYLGEFEWIEDKSLPDDNSYFGRKSMAINSLAARAAKTIGIMASGMGIFTYEKARLMEIVKPRRF